MLERSEIEREYHGEELRSALLQKTLGGEQRGSEENELGFIGASTESAG
jgi:hypothetical protein